MMMKRPARMYRAGRLLSSGVVEYSSAFFE